jgi:hypothetical protein
MRIFNVFLIRRVLYLAARLIDMVVPLSLQVLAVVCASD